MDTRYIEALWIDGHPTEITNDTEFSENLIAVYSPRPLPVVEGETVSLRVVLVTSEIYEGAATVGRVGTIGGKTPTYSCPLRSSEGLSLTN